MQSVIDVLLVCFVQFLLHALDSFHDCHVTLVTTSTTRSRAALIAFCETYSKHEVAICSLCDD